MTAKRGSSQSFIQIFQNAVDRGMDIIDAALDPIIEDGRPPLTKKLTLADLKKKPIPEAEAILREELRRTMKVDEETTMPIPDRETVELATKWIEWIHDQMQGGDDAGVYPPGRGGA